MPLSLENQSSLVVGIDLGTTNSLVAIVQDGKPRLLNSQEDHSLIPSVICFSGITPVVGFSAKKRKIEDPSSTIFSIKRLLGKTYREVKEANLPLPYEIQEGENGLVDVVIPNGNAFQTYSVVELSSLILKELKFAAEKALKQTVEKAVITVPAYFNDAQRQATRQAGRLAGFQVLRILNEPTAASLAYGLSQKKSGLIAVYDLGGGTFDLSILKLENGIFEVLATHGDTNLGGDDLDQALVQFFAKEIKQASKDTENTTEHGLDIFSDPHLLAQTLDAAENAKIQLSVTEEARIEIVYPTFTYRRILTRDTFEELVTPILKRSAPPCLRALKDAGIEASELTDVVMVGGPTRLPIVQKIAHEIFGLVPNVSVHPDEVVAEGAAIQADILSGNNKDLLLLDVIPLSLGLETYGGLMSPLITRNTRIPAVAKETFTTFVDHQTGVDFHILQGEREKALDNRSLARFKLGGIERLPAGEPRVEVTFLVDADGILQVTAQDLKSKKEQTVEIRPSFGLTDDQVEKILIQSRDGAETDVAFRRLADAKRDGESVLRLLEKNYPTLPPELEPMAKELKNLLLGEDAAAIQDVVASIIQCQK